MVGAARRSHADLPPRARCRALVPARCARPALCFGPSPRCPQYKRQLLNVLGIIHRYDRIKRMSPAERQGVGRGAAGALACPAASS